MANRIKGITVEIGGDTTGLENSLKSVNNSLKKSTPPRVLFLKADYLFCSVSHWYIFISAATQVLSVISRTEKPYACITARSFCWWAVRSSGGMVSSSYRSAKLASG